MQVWDSVKVKGDADTPNIGLAGVIQAVNGDDVTVKLDLIDEPQVLKREALERLG